jgi:hypothetical protein
MAFGARTTARSRGLVLNVRQRPSYTAGPGQHELRLTDEAHDFVRGRQHPPLEECAPGHLVTTPSGQLTITIDPLIAANTSLPVQPRPAVAPVAEWRLGSQSRTREALPWRAFPHVAEAIAEWVIKQAAATSCDVVVIAARMPQELAVGLGIQLGQQPSSWPWRMYPAIYDQASSWFSICSWAVRRCRLSERRSLRAVMA